MSIPIKSAEAIQAEQKAILKVCRFAYVEKSIGQVCCSATKHLCDKNCYSSWKEQADYKAAKTVSKPPASPAIEPKPDASCMFCGNDCKRTDLKKGMCLDCQKTEHNEADINDFQECDFT